MEAIAAPRVIANVGPKILYERMFAETDLPADFNLVTFILAGYQPVLRPNIDTHDYDVKAKAMHRFFEEGDKVKMCPGDWGPPAYEVALLKPNQAVVLGHHENGRWSDVWQFILIPQADGTTRLLARGRETKSGSIWDVIRPGQFIMERAMLLGIKERAESMAQGR